MNPPTFPPLQEGRGVNTPPLREGRECTPHPTFKKEGDAHPTPPLQEGRGIHTPPHLQEGGGFTPHPHLQEGGGCTLHPTFTKVGRGEGIHNPPHLQEGGGFTPPSFQEGRVSHPTPPSKRKWDTHPTSRLQEGGGFILHPTRSAAGAARGPSLSHPSAGRRRATRHVRLRRHRGSASHCSPAMWLHARADAVCARCAVGAANGMECGSLLLGGVGCESPSWGD